MSDGYDKEFRNRMVKAIVETVFEQSLMVVGGKRVAAIHTGETADALIQVITAMLSMSPSMDEPRTLREFTDKMAKKVRRDVARARASGTFDQFGAAPGGTA